MSASLNGMKVYGFSSKSSFINYVVGKKVVVVSAGAESIARNDVRFNLIAKNHLAYADGLGAVLALRRKGVRTVKIPGVEIWLDLIREAPAKSVYLLGGSDEVID